MNQVLLTAAMIVRNEEHCLPDCLKSIQPLVDEIVIVDTGSTDQSRAIAKAYGAKLFELQWSEDFSAARNEALRHSSGQWILYIDADESVLPVDRSRIEQQLLRAGTVAFTVRFYPYKGFTAYREYRVFRNDPRIRFDGVIHETILPSIRAVAAEDHLTIGETDLTLVHTGYDAEQDRKHARNLPLLHAQLARDPGRIYCWWHLGVVLAGLGDLAGAEDAWTSAIKIIRKKDQRQMVDSLPYADLIRLQFRKGKDVSGFLEEALRFFPEQYLLIWTKGQVLMAERRFAEAIELFERLASIDPASLESAEIAYDSRIFRVLAYEPLATCHFKLGRFGESAAYYALAANCEPENMSYRIRRQLACAKLNHP